MKEIIEKLKQIENEEKDTTLKTALALSIYQLQVVNEVYEKRKQSGIHSESKRN